MFWLFIFFLFTSSEQGRSLPPQIEEGNLQNRSFLPTLDLAAQTRLRDFEQSLRKSSTQEAWKHIQALLRSWNASDSGLYFPNERTGFSPPLFIERILKSVTEDVRARFLNQMEESSQEALLQAGAQSEKLRSLTRDFPGTDAAYEAWVRMGDLAFERGDFQGAEGCFRRASLGAKATIVNLEKRFRTLETERKQKRERPIRPSAKPEKLVAEEVFDFGPFKEDEEFETLSFPTGNGKNLLFVQTRQRVAAIDLETRNPLVWNLDESLFDRSYLSRAASSENLKVKTQTRKPQFRDGVLVLIHGDSQPNYFANRIAALDWQASHAGAEPRWIWQRGWSLEKGTELEGLSFSPEFLWDGDRLYLGAQKVQGDVESYLICLDASDGRTLWKRFLGKGSLIDNSRERLGDFRMEDIPGTGPMLFQGFLFYNSNLGFCAALDPANGELLWAYRTARSNSKETRWKPGRMGADEKTLAIAPADSSWVYFFKDPLDPNPIAFSQGESLAWLGATETGDLYWEESADTARIVFVNREKQIWKYSSSLPKEPSGSFLLDEHQLWVQAGDSLWRFDTDHQLKLDSRLSLGSPESQTSPSLRIQPILLPDGILAGVSNKLYYLRAESTQKKENK